MGGNQLRLRRESPKDTGGDNHRVSTPAYSACAQLVGSSQFRHEEASQKICVPRKRTQSPKMCVLVASQKVSVRAGGDRMDL